MAEINVEPELLAKIKAANFNVRGAEAQGAFACPLYELGDVSFTKPVGRFLVHIAQSAVLFQGAYVSSKGEVSEVPLDDYEYRTVMHNLEDFDTIDEVAGFFHMVGSWFSPVTLDVIIVQGETENLAESIANLGLTEEYQVYTGQEK